MLCLLKVLTNTELQGCVWEREHIHYTRNTSVGSFSWLNLLTAVVTPRNYTCNTATVVQTITRLTNRSQFRRRDVLSDFVHLKESDGAPWNELRRRCRSLCMHRSTMYIQFHVSRASVSRFLVAERPGCLRQHECVGRGLQTNASPHVLCLRGAQRDCRG